MNKKNFFQYVPPNFESNDDSVFGNYDAPSFKKKEKFDSKNYNNYMLNETFFCYQDNTILPNNYQNNNTAPPNNYQNNNMIPPNNYQNNMIPPNNYQNNNMIPANNYQNNMIPPNNYQNNTIPPKNDKMGNANESEEDESSNNEICLNNSDNYTLQFENDLNYEFEDGNETKENSNCKSEVLSPKSSEDDPFSKSVDLSIEDQYHLYSDWNLQFQKIYEIEELVSHIFPKILSIFFFFLFTCGFLHFILIFCFFPIS